MAVPQESAIRFPLFVGAGLARPGVHPGTPSLRSKEHLTTRSTVPHRLKPAGYPTPQTSPLPPPRSPAGSATV
jgi:hypothetical protein